MSLLLTVILSFLFPPQPLPQIIMPKIADAQVIEEITIAVPVELSIPEKIKKYADKHEVSYKEMYETIKCETAGTFDPLIQSNCVDKNGVRENSHGLAQIHLPSHPKVTKEQAQDADFALEFMAKEFSRGNQELWTCWRKLKASGKI